MLQNRGNRGGFGGFGGFPSGGGGRGAFGGLGAVVLIVAGGYALSNSLFNGEEEFDFTGLLQSVC